MTDPFAAQPMPQSTYTPDVYNNTAYGYTGHTSPPPAVPAATNPYRAPEHSYSLGGNGYGDNVVPVLNTSAYPQYGTGSPAPSMSVYSTATSSTPAPINTAVPAMPQPTSPRGPRDPTPSMPATIVESPIHEDAPPMYDAATAQPPGQWGAKH